MGGYSGASKKKRSDARPEHIGVDMKESKRAVKKMKIGNTTISVFRLSLNDELLEFYDLADEAADFMAEIGDRARAIRGKDFQGVLGVEEQVALAEVEAAADNLEQLLINVRRQIATGPTVGHLFEERRKK
jgi:hypothetical protein